MREAKPTIRIAAMLILLGLILTGSTNNKAAASPNDSDSLEVTADSTATSEIKPPMYVIESQHRLFPDFSQLDTVYGSNIFYVGEDNYAASVFTFNPHLGITQEGKALVMSDTLYNPAVRIRVIYEDSVLQETWGFYHTEKPHYYRNELLGFVLKSFDVPERYIAPATKQK